MAASLEEENEGLQDLLQCLVCLGPFESPKMLSCGHTFCTTCLQPLVGESYRREIRCPACRAISRLPWTGISGLPDDFKVNRIKEIVERQQVEEKGPRSCDFCRSRRLKVRSQFNCTQCYKYLCKSCVDKHDSNPLFKSHCVVELPDEGSTIDYTCICERHAREPVRYFCQVCRELLCTICTLDHDQQHEIRPMDRMLEQYQHTLEGILDRLGAKLAKILPIRATLEVRVKEQQVACDEAEKAIRELTESIIAETRSREHDLLNRLDQERDKRLDYAGLHILDSMNAKVREIENFNRRILDLLKETGNPYHLLSAYEAMANSAMRSLESEIPDEAPEDPTARTVVHFMESEHIPVITLGALISIEVNDANPDELNSLLSQSPSEKGWFSRIKNYWVGSNTNRQIGASRRMSDNVNSDQNNMQSVSLSTNNSKCLMTLTKVGSGFGEISAPCDIAVLPDGYLVVAEFGNKRLQIFDSKGDPNQTMSGETGHYCVAVTDQGNIVTVGSQEEVVVVYRRDGASVSIWGQGFLGRPHGVAVSKDGYVIVSDVNKHRISVHGLCGRVVKEFGCHGNEEDDNFDHPFYITVDNHGNIVVSDCWNHCIKVFDMNGQFLFKFGSFGSSIGQLRYPGGVCTDQKGNYVVADTMNHRVCIFSSDGQFSKHLVTSEDGIWYPAGLCITADNRLALTECNGMSHSAMKVFSLDE